MTQLTRTREQIAKFAKSIFDRGLTNGSTGNISVRMIDGSILVTPTGCSLGFLDPGDISHLDASGQLVDGDPPTKELPLHRAFYESRKGTGAVVHLHSTYATALSLIRDIDPDNVLPPVTPYAIMRMGKVKLLPFFLPGDPAMGQAVRDLGGKYSAILLANHGPVVAGATLETAVFAMEELEENAKLALLTRGVAINLLTPNEIANIVRSFKVDWDP